MLLLCVEQVAEHLVNSNRLFLMLQCLEVHAPCSPQTPGEHAYALGADSGCACTVPHHWSHLLCQ